MNLKAEAFWNRFTDRTPSLDRDTPFQTWYYGNTPEMASELAALVISGKKTATASLAAVNEIKPHEAPVQDGYSVVTDYEGKPLCIVQTAEIHHIPFDDVDERFASDEGEGDQTLKYWREVHHRYFAREAAELGIEFDGRSLVCCERFRLLFAE